MMLLNETQAGAQLQVSRTTLQKLKREGKLVPLKIGKSVRYAQQDVDAFVQQLIEDRRGQ